MSDGDFLEDKVKGDEFDMLDVSFNGCCFCLYILRRYIVVFLLMFGMMVVYCMRINVGVIMIIILDEEVYMKVGILEVKWNVRF